MINFESHKNQSSKQWDCLGHIHTRTSIPYKLYYVYSLTKTVKIGEGLILFTVEIFHNLTHNLSTNNCYQY